MSLFECDEGPDDHDGDDADPGVEDEDGEGRVVPGLFGDGLMTRQGLTVCQGWGQTRTKWFHETSVKIQWYNLIICLHRRIKVHFLLLQ